MEIERQFIQAIEAKRVQATKLRKE